MDSERVEEAPAPGRLNAAIEGRRAPQYPRVCWCLAPFCLSAHEMQPAGECKKGPLLKHSVVTVGAFTAEAISRARADLYFMGVTGNYPGERA